MEKKEQDSVCRDRLSKRTLQLIKHIGEKLTEIEGIKESDKKQD